MSIITAESASRLHIAPQHDFLNKLCHPSIFPHLQEYIEWRKNPETARPRLIPVSINLDPTTACDFNCGHCVDSDVLNNGKKFSDAKLFSSIEYLAKNGLRSVILIGGGDPVAHPKFQEIVYLLKKHGLQVAISSNGSRNGKICEIADKLEGKDWVRFSLDSGTEETFQKMHRPSVKISLGEICAGVERIREKNLNLSIGFSFVIVWNREREFEKASRERDAIPNIHEMVEAAKLARESGFSYISFKPFLNRFPDGGEVMDVEAVKDLDWTIEVIRESIQEARKLETKTFRVIESTNLRIFLQRRQCVFARQPCVCHMQAFRQVLSPLGIFNCPAKRGVPQARLGNENGFSGELEMRATEASVANHLDTFNAERECAEITCLYNPTNLAIDRAIRGGVILNIGNLDAKQDFFL